MKKSDVLREKIRRVLRIVHWLVIMITFLWAFATKEGGKNKNHRVEQSYANSYLDSL